MKAVHFAWAALVPLVGVLVEQAGKGMQGQTLDWLAIGPAVVGIVAVFLPAAQLALPGFKQPTIQGEMPKMK